MIPTTLSTLTAFVVGVSLLPTPIAQASTFGTHQVLADSLQRAGVSVKVNTPQCKVGGPLGWYIPIAKQMVVCQVQAKIFPSSVTTWDEEDYDTLRHEAHHVVQDCVAGVLGDDRMSVLFNDDHFNKYILGQMTQETRDFITKQYSAGGFNVNEVNMELEAWVVAEQLGPQIIADKIDDMCAS